MHVLTVRKREKQDSSLKLYKDSLSICTKGSWNLIFDIQKFRNTHHIVSVIKMTIQCGVRKKKRFGPVRNHSPEAITSHPGNLLTD